ncbi:uncharacterized protein LOC131032223 [Cryptomeria japonica]|uniref:uncharacterized protein LOC131032223 n=1 Tax=Cryptomeria japonica TaxID=3369 RepID=UPI0027DAA063|nr:uncharacterized protein LOC131032223 [Cryptomeria japonica]
MTFLTWNVRGCNALDKRRMIKRGFHQAKLEVICIQETKLGSEEAARTLGVRQRWSGFFVDAEGASSGLGILWNPQLVKVEAVSSSRYWQLAKVSSRTINFSGFLINVYGPIKIADKCQLWEEITKTLEDIRLAITIVVGDFNSTLSHSDKRGGVRRMCRIQTNFQTFVDSNASFEVVAKGRNFTWTNRRLGFSNIAEKLDRFFLAGDWNLAPLIFEVEVLAIFGSNHFSVSLVLQKDGVPLICPFKKSKSWNRTVFGNIFEEKRKIEEGRDFLEAKSRENWIRVGDRNTKFFHSLVKVKRSLNRILSLRLKDGTLTEDFDRINQEAIDFFGNLWNKSGIDRVRLKAEFLVVIPQLVTKEDNQMLEEPVSLKELKAAIFGLGGEKPSGTDGFQEFFYQFFGIC